MFGNVGAFVNGNMFAGLFGPTIGVNLAADEHAALLAGGGGPFGPAERPMKAYLASVVLRLVVVGGAGPRKSLPELGGFALRR